MVTRSETTYRPASDTAPANTVPAAIVERNATAQNLVAPKVPLMDALAGPNLAAGRSGLFRPTASLACWASTGGGQGLGSGLSLANGPILGEGFILGETADPARRGGLLGEP